LIGVQDTLEIKEDYSAVSSPALVLRCLCDKGNTIAVPYPARERLCSFFLKGEKLPGQEVKKRFDSLLLCCAFDLPEQEEDLYERMLLACDARGEAVAVLEKIDDGMMYEVAGYEATAE
jgi:hypothetical protein